VADYAARKNMPFEVAERWLGPALGYWVLIFRYSERRMTFLKKENPN
jgi:hypothetical protein